MRSDNPTPNLPEINSGSHPEGPPAEPSERGITAFMEAIRAVNVADADLNRDEAVIGLRAYLRAAVDWKAEWEAERQKFQQETRRTSLQADLLHRIIERLKSEGHTDEHWTKACALCDLAREAKALLEQPLNAPSGGPAPSEAAPDSAKLAEYQAALESCERHCENIGRLLEQEREYSAALRGRAPGGEPPTRKTCPCELVGQCRDQCSCANEYASGGCDRCCKYGSAEQQLAAAKDLAGIHASATYWRTRSEQYQAALRELVALRVGEPPAEDGPTDKERLDWLTNHSPCPDWKPLTSLHRGQIDALMQRVQPE